MSQSSFAPWILGISASHNGGACLLRGDERIVAIQEERLTGRKRQEVAGAQPALSIRYCLDHAGISAADLSAVAICVQGRARAEEHDLALNPALRTAFHGLRTYVVPHHYGHAVSALATSGHQDAAILVVDGIGSPFEDLLPEEQRATIPRDTSGWEIISLYHARGTQLRPLEKHLVEQGAWWGGRVEGAAGALRSFASLGGMFSAIATLMFGESLEAGKVMGLAPYGEPNIPASDFFQIVDGRLVFSDALPRRLPYRERWPAHQREYQDLAASAQRALEEALLYLAFRLRTRSGSENLCYAGGVALNSVANERLIRESGFKDVHIVPAAEDSGVALGAAYHALWQLTSETRNLAPALVHDAMGRDYPPAAISAALEQVPCISVTRPADVLGTAVDLLCDGKILGWFQGRSELGPRALGQRSILCDPRRPDGKEVLNRRVKHREAFRPFAPAVLLEEAPAWFDVDGEGAHSPHMLRVIPFRDDKKPLVPAVVHVDGTGRIQTVTRAGNGLFYDLIRAFFARTGVPILLNTSFNVMGEPIVETPEDALWSLLCTGLDCCVFPDAIAARAPGYRSLLDLYPRVTARRITVAKRIEPGAGLLDLDERAAIWAGAETPLGESPRALTLQQAAILEASDGRRDGWAVREALSGDVPLDEQAMTLALGKLRRMGVLTLAAAPD
ncbi:carbamoyltransferase family protein [Sorangium sp. So ce1389]|uniref:carbamoyltransferase family protein n=1 Tax=Sorangium sp. So ce1389 TaxID=3133336 RepID=UPI003F5F932F